MITLTVHSARMSGLTLTDALSKSAIMSGTALLASAQAYTVARLVTGKLMIPGHEAFREDADVAPTSSEQIVPESSLDQVFEARIFNHDVELRWLHDDAGLGTAVLLSESEVAFRAPTDLQECATLACVESLTSRYLLWGRPLAAFAEQAAQHPAESNAEDDEPYDGSDPDAVGPIFDVESTAEDDGQADQTVWLRLAEARIGHLDIPVPRSPTEAETAFLQVVEYITVEPEHGNAAIGEERLVGIALRRPLSERKRSVPSARDGKPA